MTAEVVVAVLEAAVVVVRGAVLGVTMGLASQQEIGAMEVAVAVLHVDAHLEHQAEVARAVDQTRVKDSVAPKVAAAIVTGAARVAETSEEEAVAAMTASGNHFPRE